MSLPVRYDTSAPSGFGGNQQSGFGGFGGFGGGQQGGYGGFGGFGGQQGGFGGQQGGYGGFGGFGGQQGGFGGQQGGYGGFGGFGGQQGGFGGQQQTGFGGFGAQQGGYGGFGGQGGYSPIPQFQSPFGPQQQFNPETYQRNPNLQKPYTPQRQMTPEQQRMQNIAGIHTPDYYQQQQPQPEPVANNQDMMFRPAVKPPSYMVAEEYNPARQMQDQQRREQQNQLRAKMQSLLDGPMGGPMAVKAAMSGPMGGLLNRFHQGPGPGQFGYGDAPATTQEQLRSNIQQAGPSPAQGYGGLGAAGQQPRGMTMDMPQRYGRQLSPNPYQTFGAAPRYADGGMINPVPTIINPYSPEDRNQFGFQIPHQLQMNQQRPDPNMQQQRPDPYQMYGGLGSLFRMQDAYSQRPGPITQEQSNEANRRLMERYKAAAQQQAQQQAQQVVQQQYTQPSGNQAMWDGGQGG